MSKDSFRPAPNRKAVSRRDFLRLGSIGGAAVALTACVPKPSPPAPEPPTPAWPPPGAPQVVPSPTPEKAAGLRIAHISDMHVEPGGPAIAGFKRALRHVHGLSPTVDFVLNTGDCIMDALAADKEGAQRQWNAFNGILEAECRLPVYHALGNHDVWGWGLPTAAQSEARSDPLFGKGMALEQLRIPNRFYSFDRGGWRFLILDSTHPPDITPGKPYTGRIDEEQYLWLESQLQETAPSVPVCVVSHIPVLAACMFLDGDNESSGNWVVPGAWVHIDARRLWELFWQHPNVRLCLSGHTHQVEDLRYHGVKYLTNGAISANWWNGDYFDFPPGYVVLTLYADGSSESEFVAY
ncbi:MAG TPA: metallophosphoesterase [Anaerolineales bacterium]|nr:metallophosphoesterase [Anaerolineales bacterium]